MFPAFTLLAGPKHSTSVPFSAGSAVPLSVDVKVGPFVPNPAPGVAVKALPGPQITIFVTLCTRAHALTLSLSTLQVVTPLKSPVTVQLKVKVSLGQVGGAAVNCPSTSPGDENAHFRYTVRSFKFTKSSFNS